MAETQNSATFAFDRTELCWPVLFHLEPLISAYSWKLDFSVKVSNDLGATTYPDVASARAASTDLPPRRVEMYASAPPIKTGIWVVGFPDGEQPAVTTYSDTGMTGELNEIQQALAEFLGRNGVDIPAPDLGKAADSGTPARQGAWRWVTNQPMAVQIVGGVIATLLASGIAALITTLFR